MSLLSKYLTPASVDILVESCLMTGAPRPAQHLCIVSFASPAHCLSKLQAYLAGLTFALVASPCSTPVLATLLAYVSSTRDPLAGGSLLLTYTTGYHTPPLPRLSSLLYPVFVDILDPSTSFVSFVSMCRYVAPLLVAATFTGALKRVMSLRQWSGWITPASGVCLLAGGTYGLLSRTLPA